MDRKVILSDRAQADLRAIVIYVSADNPDAALKLGEDLINPPRPHGGQDDGKETHLAGLFDRLP